MDSNEVYNLSEAYKSMYEMAKPRPDTIESRPTQDIGRTSPRPNPKPGPGNAFPKPGPGTPPRNPGPPQRQIQKPSGGDRVIKNSADLFDIVKGHLLDEGYADTEEAALAIMANMSEEWRQSIVEAPMMGVARRQMGVARPRPGQRPMPDRSTPQDRRDAERIRNTPLGARLTAPGGPIRNPGPATGPNGFLNR